MWVVRTGNIERRSESRLASEQKYMWGCCVFVSTVTSKSWHVVSISIKQKSLLSNSYFACCNDVLLAQRHTFNSSLKVVFARPLLSLRVLCCLCVRGTQPMLAPPHYAPSTGFCACWTHPLHLLNCFILLNSAISRGLDFRDRFETIVLIFIKVTVTLCYSSNNIILSCYLVI